MRKTLTAALAALTFGGAVAATAQPAAARPHGGWNHGGYRYDHRHRHHGNDAGVAIAAGVVGLALGAALASDSGRRGYYDGGYRRSYGYSSYYGPGYGYSSYYDPGYGYYDDGYRVCESSRLVWDPYIRRRVEVRSRYAC
ncbi:hypothetical protein LJR225_002734 [Phenylobacterium sp. LjRoot225]|uniref:hypothetical protein n=1 Tax=Phenylobacterium sp. LjRoot225 TaxID=3342285 RepID=UPI003ECFF044